MKPAISVENISKRYKIGLSHDPNKSFREAFVETVTLPFRRLKELGEESSGDDLFWALKDISLRIDPGEVVGIVGRNGAGKSTLLKILACITVPTSGQAVIRGRVGSLLEVGTGFHQELTGRENIYLNGAILGMKKVEIERKFDEIVRFAEVEKFLDTPVKRYSSGMRVRLAFAVAAHLEPEVLLIDEVLAVGDAAFQKKCLRAMESMHKGGRTVLFVSHNMAAIENLCPRTIWVEQGKIEMDGDTHDVLKNYLATFSSREQMSYDLTDFEARTGSGEIQYTGIEFLDRDGKPRDLLQAGDDLTLRLHYSATSPVLKPQFAVEVYTELGTRVTTIDTWTSGYNIESLQPGSGHIDVQINFLNLRPGRYSVSLWLGGVGSTKFDYLERCSILDVIGTDFYNSGRVIDGRYGIVFLDYKWTR